MADVDVPKVGKVNKKILVPIVVAAGGYIAYRYWQARNTVSTGAPTDPGFQDAGTIPGVSGAVSPTNSYGSGGGGTSGATTGGFAGTTNSAWSEWVLDRLQQDTRWSYTQIATALGNFLDNKPLSSEQQDIARAAVGVAGYPPVGSHTIVSGGNTPITVAPTGVTGTATPTGITVSFTAVPGAVTYNAYIGGTARATGPGAPLKIDGLTPGTSYTVTVAAVSSSGAVGPKSSAITVKTPGVVIGTPAKPAVASIVGNRVTLTTHPVPYATTYKWFLNGTIFNSTNTPAVTLTNLKNKARYAPGVSVQAAGTTGSPGKLSSATSFTTK